MPIHAPPTDASQPGPESRGREAGFREACSPDARSREARPRVSCRRVTGRALEAHLDAVAALRIAVFRDWPYLYDGDMDYERTYLAAYAASTDSVCVLAFDGERIVGASTGLPLADDAPAFRAPFDAAGIDAARVFYFGESVLRPEYRGLGLGHAFFDHREAHARALGRFDITAFCAVDRAPDDPRRPAAHRDLHGFWRSRGYAQRPGMRMRLDWKDVGAEAECAHALTFWTRRWPAAHAAVPGAAEQGAAERGA